MGDGDALAAALAVRGGCDSLFIDINGNRSATAVSHLIEFAVARLVRSLKSDPVNPARATAYPDKRGRYRAGLLLFWGRVLNVLVLSFDGGGVILSRSGPTGIDRGEVLGPA